MKAEQSAFFFLTLSLGNIRGVYFVLATSLVLPGHWTKATATMQRCYNVLIRQSLLDLTRFANFVSSIARMQQELGLPGHWKIRKIFHVFCAEIH